MATTAPPVSEMIALGRLMRSKLDGMLPLSLTQCEVLRLVAEEKHPSMRRIAEYFKITPPSATALVEHLVKEKMVERKSDPADRRQILLAPTKKGLALDREIAAKKKIVLNKLFKPLPKKDIEALKRILIHIIENA